MSIGNKVRLAIEVECSSIKAGNVHPTASFDDLTHADFMAAAMAIGKSIDQSADMPIGQIVLASVRAMMDAVSTNTSLGTILLMAPLIKASSRIEGEPTSRLRKEIQRVLVGLTGEDSQDIYTAIQLAKPGGLGETVSMDVRSAAPTSILEAMKLASEWDDVALQYVTDFELVFLLAEQIRTQTSAGLPTLDAIRCLQLVLLSQRADSLIARKRGLDFAKQVQRQAREVVEAGPYGSDAYEIAWHRFDCALRDSRHSGNPGTTADLLAAAMFACELQTELRLSPIDSQRRI